jgi:hypothetical protein
MTDLENRRAALQRDVGQDKLIGLQMPSELAELVYDYALYYRTELVTQGVESIATNPIELFDFERLDNAWAFSLEGITLLRIAIDDEDGLSDQTVQQVVTGRPDGCEVSPPIQPLKDFLHRQSPNSDDTVPLALALSGALVGFFYVYAETIAIHQRDDGGLTYVFDLNQSLDDIQSLRLDYYLDFWQLSKK